MRHFVSIAFVAALLLALPTAHATEYTKSCDVYAGYYGTAVTETFGYITDWEVGMVPLISDIEVQGPRFPKAALGQQPSPYRAVAVLERVTWNGLPNGNISFTVRVSANNVARIMGVNYAVGMGGLSTRIAFNTREYSPITKVHFAPLTTSPSALGGGVAVDGLRINATFVRTAVTDVFLKHSEKPEEDPAGIPNYVVEFTLAPLTGVQQLFAATSATRMTTLPWGIKP